MDIERQIKRAKRLHIRTVETLSVLKRTSVAVLLNELELGLFLARFARDSRLRNRAEWQRQKASAREAYRRVVGFLPAMAATSEQRATIKRRLSRLHSTLRELS